jgi:hypothetical protein
MAGFDVKALIDGIIEYLSSNYLLVLAGLVLLVLFRSTGFFARVRNGIEKALTQNWQLTLLASTGIALSLASAYTTWDGLRNFTRAPLLSVAISFGIQGVMLIVAWLIGESFAVGMNQRTADGKRLRLVDATVGMLLGLVLVGIGFYWTLHQSSAITFTSSGFRADPVRFVDVSVYFLLALVLVALMVLGFRRGGEISTPYVQSVRLIIKNAVLWVMFVASMTASVFFSFDSHFNAIFPEDARKRAAEIRSTAQIGGVVADIGALTQKRQIEEAERLFDTEGWKVYDKQLSSLAQAAQGAQAEIERYFVQLMEERRRAVNQQQERIATAQSGQAGLAGKKVSLTDELSRLKAERPALAAEYAQHKTELDAKAKEIDAKRVEALAEDRGVEGTLKQGKGPVYRQRMAEFGTLQDQYKIKQERTKDAQKRLTTVETRIAQIERELSTVDGDLAKLKGEAETAEQRIKAVQAASADDDGINKLDPARVLPAFERARAAFRQQPDTERLALLQQQCTNLLGAMSGNQVTKEKVRSIDCDPKQAAEAAARVFALNAGLAAFQANCAGGDKLARQTSTDALLGFGRKCLQDSGLISKDSTDIGARLSGIDMNRDDKAHRFVVTWNAFLDGNRLAYLSLVLAIGVDALVFMSGLFGAQALRSPLSDVPSPKARSAEQLEAIIKNSLGAERLENAELVLAAMQPSTAELGYHAEINLSEYGAEKAARIRKVLVAGASIGAVKRADPGATDERYFIRSELFEFLSVVSHAAKESDSDYVERARLVQIVGVALEPNQPENARTALHYMDPINQRHGFIAKVELDRVPKGDQLLLRNLLNAGMTVNAVQRNDRSLKQNAGLAALLGRSAGIETTYFVRTDLFRTLLMYSADAPSLLAGRRGDAPRLRVRPEPPAERLTAEEPRQLPRLLRTPASTTADGPQEDTFVREIWSELLGAINLDLAQASRVKHPAVREQAAKAWDALEHLAQSNSRLRLFLKEVEDARKDALDQKYSEIRSDLNGDASGVVVLDEAGTDLDRIFKALLLLPETGVIQELINALEDAAQSDDGQRPGEQELLALLRAVQAEIERIDKSRAEAWKHIVHMIETRKSDGQSHTIRDLDTINKRPF